jgi:hypothetical protein
MPPSLSGTPPMGASPISVPSGSPGSSAGAMSKVREAINILQGALPELSPGTDEHKAVLNAISSMSKYVAPSAAVPGVQKQTLSGLQQNAQQSAMLRSVMSSLGGANAGGGGAPPGAAAA